MYTHIAYAYLRLWISLNKRLVEYYIEISTYQEAVRMTTHHHIFVSISEIQNCKIFDRGHTHSNATRKGTLQIDAFHTEFKKIKTIKIIGHHAERAVRLTERKEERARTMRQGRVKVGGKQMEFICCDI